MAYKLPTIDLFAPKSKGQGNEKRIVCQNIKVLEDTASFGIKVVVERAEIGPSVTRYELKPAVEFESIVFQIYGDDLDCPKQRCTN